MYLNVTNIVARRLFRYVCNVHIMSKSIILEKSYENFRSERLVTGMIPMQ